MLVKGLRTKNLLKIGWLNVFVYLKIMYRMLMLLGKRLNSFLVKLQSHKLL